MLHSAPPRVLGERALVCFLFATLAVWLPACRSKEPAPAERNSARIRSRAGKARSAGASAGAPRLAIIIDDLGYDRPAAGAVFQIPLPVTLAVLPHLPYSAAIAEEAYRRGFPVLLHLPMESADSGAKRESIELRPGMTPEEAAQMVAGMLATVPHAVGVNNHQGSRATADPALMAAIMPVLRERGLFFIDSRTTVESQAYRVARHAGVPAAYRSVFLDDTPTGGDGPAREAALRQLHLAAEEARRQGWAIAIGHPHPATLEAIREFLADLEAQGVRLVYVSELVGAPELIP